MTSLICELVSFHRKPPNSDNQHICYPCPEGQSGAAAGDRWRDAGPNPPAASDAMCVSKSILRSMGSMSNIYNWIVSMIYLYIDQIWSKFMTRNVDKC